MFLIKQLIKLVFLPSDSHYLNKINLNKRKNFQLKSTVNFKLKRLTIVELWHLCDPLNVII